VKTTIRDAALIAFRLALRPLVRLMLRNGITWKESTELLKQTYVEVAQSDYGLHGRTTNTSRIAILTGLNRREVKRVKDTLAMGEEDTLNKMNSATRLLGAWHTDRDYRASDGQPAPLNLADDDNSFTMLCKRYVPDIPPTAMLKELRRVGAIRQLEDLSVEPTMRYYMPDQNDPDALVRTGSVLEDIGNNLEYNLRQDRPADKRTRFEGRAWNADIPATAAKEFRDYLEDEGQAMLERMDEWLARHEANNDSKRPRKKLRLGVGVYQIEEENKR
jgi:hypothetical protein